MVDQSVNGGRKVGHVGGLIVRVAITQWYVLPPPATRHCRSPIFWKQRPDQHQKGMTRFYNTCWRDTTMA